MPDLGIGEAIAAALTSVGVGTETAGAIAPILTGIGTGSALGAGTSAVTGGNIGTGALTGAITGGAVPAGGELAGAAGLPTELGQVLGGAAGGAAGSAATGGNILTGTLTGGAEGGVSALLSPGTSSTQTGGTSVGGTGASAGAVAAPASVSPDLSSALPSSTPSDIATSGGVDVGTNVGAANPNQLMGTITSPAAGGTGQFVNNPIYGTGTDATGGQIYTPSTMDQASKYLTGTSDAASAPAAGGGAAKGPSSVSSFLSNPTLSGAGNVLASNPGALLSVGGLGLSALTSQQTPKGYNALTQEAQQLGSQGTQLASYLTTGTLPAGVQQQLNSAAEQAKAAVRARYANMPGSSSAEAQDLAAIDEAKITQGTQIAESLLSTGISESNLAANLYQKIMQSALEQDKSLGSAITGFATSLAGGGSSPNSITLKASA